jgi:hypothetical protein
LCCCANRGAAQNPAQGAELHGVIQSVVADQDGVILLIDGKRVAKKVFPDLKVYSAEGQELADGLRAKELIAGAAVSVTLEQNGDKRPIKTIRLGGGATSVASPNAAPMPTGDLSFAGHVVPFVAKYCVSCHSGDEPKGELALDVFHDEAAMLRERAVWEGVAENLRLGVMPPKQAKPRPSTEESAAISRWIESRLAAAVPTGGDPGRVTMRRLNRAEYRNTIRDLLDVEFAHTNEFPADDSHKGFDTNGDSLSLSTMLLEKYVDAAEEIGAQVFATPSARAHLMAYASSAGTNQQRVRGILENVARRAFRRPVTAVEVDRLVKFVSTELADESPGALENAARLGLQAILVSPHFLYRIEFDPEPGNPKAIHPVSEFELASRLSYFLWSSMPDDKLFNEAREGTLRQNLNAQVRRMLLERKSRALAEDFGGQWLQIRRLQVVSPDSELFPDFDEELREAMAFETTLFFETIVREDRSLLDFIDAPFTFVNQRLARHYGIPNVSGPIFQRVELAGGQRGGVVTQASVLTVTSHPDRTSAVKRGKWVLENLLGTPPPPPPPDIPSLDQKKDAAGELSLRKQLELHRADVSCASCHERMDPIGFGLENYNAIGAWRERDGASAIDATGVLPDGRSFQGPAELKSVLKGQADQFTRSLTEFMLTYALGRGLESYDQPVIDRISRSLAKNNHRFSALVQGIVTSQPFQNRRGERNEP